VIAIVGRPNVGKSSLLNLLARERISIVDPRAGITRDRVSVILEHEERYFELVDTGGIGIVDDDQLEAHVEEQIRFALARATIILFVVDVQQGPLPLDQTVADLLRKLGRPVVVIANKADLPQHEAEAGIFARLGFGEPAPVSCLHSRGRPELLNRLEVLLEDLETDAPQAPEMRLAIVGKRNAGKSTLVNALAGEPRMIVSEVPGTTRDAVDVRFERDGRALLAIDTAGVRKKARMNDIEFYSYTRALRSIERADVVMLLIDATVPIAEPDLKLAAAIREAYKPVLVGINKWDLAVGQAEASDYAEYLEQAMPALSWAPLVFMTAQTGRNVGNAVDIALGLHDQTRTRVPTAALNTALEEILQLRAPSAGHGARPVRIYYATQVSIAPPTIVFFCNDPALVTENYRRFMENRLRERLPFREVPMRLWFRPRRQAKLAPERKGTRR
jgi:GTP-binding protein